MEVVIIFNIDPRSSTPIYEQIIASVKENIIKGILQAGDKLPSVRELAAMLTTNPNTVSKAYSELERMKIIETLRGKGTFVSEEYKPKLEEDMVIDLKNSLKQIILNAHYMGMTKEDLIEIINGIYGEFENSDEGVHIDEK
ncbi:HTH-type transcriptional repressor YtrA [Clostridium oryzae]|uniref:HTH-type transcriptional repressor YtrA n=1 Tax=Clostridium oryzae TaxID=1450648 RepID=A0A1V4IXW2_9CLOT|nr:HTH-type transcriptional repressor YtrA [Clostridium oryzae]